MVDINSTGGTSGLNVTSLLVQVAVAKNQELKELIDQPTQKPVEKPSVDEKANAKVEATSSQGDSPSLKADQSAGRVLNVEV